MVTKTLFISLALTAAAGCGNDVSVPDATVNVDQAKTTEDPVAEDKRPVLWSEQDISDANVSCQDSVTEHRPDTEWASAERYCACVIEEVSKKWDVSEFVKHQSSYMDSLAKDGTVKKCQDIGGIVAKTTETTTIENKTIVTKTTEKTDEMDISDKLLRGMTKENVLRILGKPTSIEDDSWVYSEDPNRLNICANPLNYQYINVQCRVFFDGHGILDSQQDIAVEYIDITNF